MAKIAYISDTHIDFYAENKPAKIRKHADKIVPDHAKEKDYYDAIIVAGDIGHYNKDNIVFLKQLKNYAANVICVLGNHDHWLLTKSQKKKYKFESKSRVEEFGKMCKESNIQLLDPGHTIIKSKDGKPVSILGFNGWYDGKYMNADPVFLNIDWPKVMNDARHICSTPESYDSLHKQDMQKLNNLLNFRGDDLQPDIIVSHVRPTINPWNIQEKYRRDKNTPFYCFDGSVLMQKLKPKYWIYGHTHDGQDFVENGVQVVTNAFGYPGELTPDKGKLKEINI